MTLLPSPRRNLQRDRSKLIDKTHNFNRAQMGYSVANHNCVFLFFQIYAFIDGASLAKLYLVYAEYLTVCSIQFNKYIDNAHLWRLFFKCFLVPFFIHHPILYSLNQFNLIMMTGNPLTSLNQ